MDAMRQATEGTRRCWRRDTRARCAGGGHCDVRGAVRHTGGVHRDREGRTRAARPGDCTERLPRSRVQRGAEPAAPLRGLRAPARALPARQPDGRRRRRLAGRHRGRRRALRRVAARRAAPLRPQPGPGRGVPCRVRQGPRDLLRGVSRRDARSGHDQRPRRAPRDARASAERRRGGAGVVGDAQRERPAADAEPRRRLRGPALPRRRGQDGLVVLPRLPRLDAARGPDALRRRPHPRAGLRLQGGDPREARVDGREDRGGPGRARQLEADRREQDARDADRARVLPHAGPPGLHARDRDPERVTRPSVGIVGGGILGMTSALRLAQAGVHVALYERAPDLGGLVGSFDFNGHDVDRFYHVVLPTDDRVIGLAEELGLGEDQWRFRPTKVGFYGDGRLFSMTSPKEFLTFPLMGMASRMRLAAFVARCQLQRSHDALDDEELVGWLTRLCGKKVVEALWKPLLDSKFDGRYDDLPATYIWARSRRMGTTRDKSGREVMGWVQGGYQAIIDRMAAKIVELGGEVHPATAVDQIVGSNGVVQGLKVEGRFRPFDSVLCTLVPPQARGLLSPDLAARAPEDHCRYLGVVCMLLRTRRSISPYYHLNITDRTVPLTTVVETTHVVDPEAVGGHLMYVSKYVDPSHPDQTAPLDEIEREFLEHARTIFPTLTDEDILASVVQRARVTEPVHTLGGAGNLPHMFSVPNLALASTAHVYPEIVSGQAVTGVVERVLPGILQRLPRAQNAAA